MKFNRPHTPGSNPLGSLSADLATTVADVLNRHNASVDDVLTALAATVKVIVQVTQRGVDAAYLLRGLDDSPSIMEMFMGLINSVDNADDEADAIKSSAGGIEKVLIQPDQQFADDFQAKCREAHANAVSKGFWQAREALLHLCASPGLAGSRSLWQTAEKLITSQNIALMHSELSEALEGDRKDLEDDHLPQFDMLTVELADVIIRIMDHAGWAKLPVGAAIIAKMEYNANRPHMHGGKKF